MAASLQLFKEIVPPPTGQPDVSSISDTLLKSETLPDPSRSGCEEVSGAQFVKRTEWPDRENAATRRDKSAAAQDRARTRERKGDIPQSSASADGRRLTGSSVDNGDLSRTPSRVRVPRSHGEFLPQSP